MTKEEIDIQNEIAHYFSLLSNGEEAHFYPGNGLPVGVYQPLLQQLTNKYNISSLAFRASWKNAPAQNQQVNWHVYADDLIAFIEKKYSQPIVGIGHSQGANATIIAAAKRPDLFKELYLIDPVSVSNFEALWISYVPYAIKKKLEPFKSALKKKNIWQQPEEYYNFLRKSKGFKRISDENLQLFTAQSLNEMAPNKHQLIFPVDWEVANYALPNSLDNYIQKIEIPHKIIMGKPSVFLNTKVRANWQKIVKGEIVVNKNYGHLIPLEAPDYCAEQILM